MSFFECSRLKAFGELINCLDVMLEQPEMTIDDKGISCMGMDPSHVAMVQFNLPPGYFDKFTIVDFGGEKNVWDIGWLKKRVFKNPTKDEYLTFQHNLADEKQIWTRRSRDLKRIKRMPDLEPMEEEPPKPKLFHKGHVRILSSVLYKGMQDFVDDQHVQLKLENDIFSLSQKDDVGDQVTPWEKDCDAVLEMKMEEPCITGTYTVSYLVDILNAARKVSEVVTLSWSDDMPIKIDVELPQGTLLFWVAPCIGV